MSRVVIGGVGLGKRYAIGERERYLAMRDLLANALRAPARLFRAGKNSGNHQRQHIWALKDASFEIGEGEVVGIIGRNGAGKTTLLKILARVTRPTEGYAEVHGSMGSLLEVGTGFHLELTGRENVFLSGAILGMRKREIARKFDEIVAFAEIEKFIDTPLKHYSTGMYVRLAFAVAAHLEPDILYVDEVLAVGDAAFQKKCMGKMGEVAHEGRTILFVSHNMTAMRSLCSRGYLLEGGRIAHSGPIGECIDHYLESASDGMSAEVATQDLRRVAGAGHDGTVLRITRVRLETPSGQAVLYSGQPLNVRMDFDVSEAVKNVVVGLSIHSSDGLRLFECRSHDSYGPIEELRPGQYSIQCSIPSNPLNPGLYRLDVGARCENKGLDWLPDVMIFRVESCDKLGSVWMEERSGLVRQASEWTPATRQSSQVG